MNRHGRRFISTRDFRSHANSLHVKFLDDRELEFYEQHCLLLPVGRLQQPPAYLIAMTATTQLWPVTNPEDLTPPDAFRRLQRSHADGLHPFDAERDRNPFLVAPDCSTFWPWEADETIAVTAPDGHVVRRPTVERYYAPWQVHVVELLRRQKYYYVHSRFLRHIDPSHDLWNRHRLPEDTEWARSLRGMANGFDALERYRYADQVALNEAFDGVPAGTPLPEPALAQLRVALSRWSQQALEISGLDEPAFFAFLTKLVGVIDDYKSDERAALAEDAEEYLRDAQALARDAFAHDWESFLAAAEEHIGAGLVAQLRWVDPLEAAAQAARENLARILEQDPVAAIVSGRADAGDAAHDIVEFCLEHDLAEVLYSLQRSSYTDADQRGDRFPGFLNRRLRPLALAGEQLARCILDTLPEPAHDASDAMVVSHHGRSYSELIEILGAESSWLPHFKRLVSRGATSDKRGDLEQRAMSLTEAAHGADIRHDEAITNTLAAAVATRNLVSHRHRFLPTRVVRTLGGPCIDAVILIWLLARDRGLV